MFYLYEIILFSSLDMINMITFACGSGIVQKINIIWAASVSFFMLFIDVWDKKIETL
jgi:hypothetical protein